jgi:isopentenyl diphosphate isomerase/L-lactate dehydrogenase-like FMN-dependent dehydrogenase
VAALGKYGGDHVTEILMEELKNNMTQCGVTSIDEIRQLHPFRES